MESSNLGRIVSHQIPPSHQFDDSMPHFQELKDVLRKARNASSPGLPYKMYKKCPRLLRIIWNLVQVVWRTKHIPVQWRVAEGIYIPKSTTPNETTITDFRPIALLNVSRGKDVFRYSSEAYWEV